MFSKNSPQVKAQKIQKYTIILSAIAANVSRQRDVKTRSLRNIYPFVQHVCCLRTLNSADNDVVRHRVIIVRRERI